MKIPLVTDLFVFVQLYLFEIIDYSELPQEWAI